MAPLDRSRRLSGKTGLPGSHRAAWWILVALLGALTGCAPAPTRVLQVELGERDSACNYAPDPQVLEVAAGSHVLVELAVPGDVRIQGWECSYGRCTRTYRPDVSMLEALVVDNGNPRELGGALLGFDVGDERPIPAIEGMNCFFQDGKLICPDLTVPRCCACPCSFAENCG